MFFSRRQGHSLIPHQSEPASPAKSIVVRGRHGGGNEVRRDEPDAAPIGDEAWFGRAQLVIPALLKDRWVQIDHV
jgi:hypothetical protein